MTIYAGIKITMECLPNYPVDGTGGPWVATIDNGPQLRAATAYTGQQIITSSTLSGLCTAVQSAASLSGAT